MAKYKRVKGGEKNKLSGTPFKREELEQVADLYIEMNGKGIHENNPKIHYLAEILGRTIRSVENQLLGYKLVATKNAGRKNYNKLIPVIWEEKQKEIAKKAKANEKEKVIKKEEFQDVKFRISSKLKNIIGRDLITDDQIAIFELVKNSFDAHAKKIKIIFERDKIIIWDDGKGMDKSDLINKWLFVAYSAKNEGVEDLELESKEYKNYRNNIKAKNRYAGAKGIGRFSADRLGSKLKLTTRKVKPGALFWELNFDWDNYEENAETEFVNIDVEYKSSDKTSYSNFKHGVIIEISNLRSVWPHQKILDLKWSLEKLINPFESIDKIDGKNNFGIEIISLAHKEKDEEIKKDKAHSKRDLVNGSVNNFIFETLSIKTTQIISKIVEEGDYIETELIDRGNLIYKIREENKYNYITENSKIHLFYLNKTAKTNFTKLMGIRPIRFGSIFFFNNGFRVYPMGEVGDDSFGIDKRKTQGFARYLGLRDLIGRIEIWNGGEQFREKSSRDGGLIDTPGVTQMEKFLINTLYKLEKYVQPVLWQIKKRTGDEDETLDFDAQAQIIDLVSKFTDNDQIDLISHSKDLLKIVNAKLGKAPPEVFNNLRKIAETTKNKNFLNQIDKSEEAFIKIQGEKDEEEQKRIEAENKAEIEEQKRIEAEIRAEEESRKRKEAEYQRLKAEEEAREEREKRVNEEQKRRQRESQVRFLESVKSLDIEDVLNLNHQIGIDANTIETIAANVQRKIIKNKSISPEDLKGYMEDIVFATKKILAVVKFTTKQNFMAAARLTEDDLISFLKNYIVNIYKKHIGKDIELHLNDQIEKPFILKFKPIEITIVIDNLLSNSRKKNANNAYFTFQENSKKGLIIRYSDDGNGLNKTILEPDNIFEKGFTTTRGSGLGLFHVQKIVRELGGKISVNSKVEKGIEFIITIPKK